MNRKDFVNLNRLGKRRFTNHFTIVFMENGLGFTRLGITVSKRTGNAVKRNRVKRLIREFCRLNKSEFPRGVDFNIITKKKINDLDFREVDEELRKVLLDKSFDASS